MKLWNVLHLLVIVTMVLSLGALSPSAQAYSEGQPGASPIKTGKRAGIAGPIVGQPVAPFVFNGDLRDLPQIQSNPNVQPREMPRPGIPGKSLPTAPVGARDPVAQTEPGSGQMPPPIMNFDGLNITESGGWHPPDTNGDVGPDYYIQVVNIAIGIYTKTTGLPAVKISYNDFFQGPPGSPCNDQNRGDVVVLYDPMADRWIITDFSLPAGQSHECIAVSQSGNPISGGWYFYDLNTLTGDSWCDYPKLGVWPDAYYLSCNMFDPWIGAKVWALDRAAMLNNQPMNWVSFEAGTAYATLLPANMRGDLPPAGSPNYFASIDLPDTLHLWKFHVDWVHPISSTFTGPADLTVAPFGIVSEIPQKGTAQTLDSLGDRLMFSLHYRNRGSYESLWVNHTVASGDAAGVRWYEVRDPGGTPVLYQQGTFQPDANYRWMGSVATDQDGNMALGYSVSSGTMYPSIRYAGRLYGEPLGALLQGETSLIEGTGSQIGSNRWGDYSAMTVDPTDDCTFWYTQEYLPATNGNWYTRIGSFRFPSCGQPKGWITGAVSDADSGISVAGAPIVAEGVSTTLTAETDASGQYNLILPSGVYTLTAGPFLPGYPDPVMVADVVVTAAMTATVNISLTPHPYLVEDALSVNDNVPGGNNNGYPEPNEKGLGLWEAISNTGATTATNVTAHLVALTAGISITVADAGYPDLAAGASQTNTTPFEFSIAPTITCGARIDFQKVVATDQGVYTMPVQLYLGVPQPPSPLFSDDMEHGAGSWTAGGVNNQWAITTEAYHSPTHAWSDSPSANYLDDTDAWLRSPVFDLSDKTGLALTFWHRYTFETGFDFGYVQYSTDGGATWKNVSDYTGTQAGWSPVSLDMAALNEQSNAAFRFRLKSDSGVTADGWHIDDVSLLYQPFLCVFPTAAPAVPILIAPPDNTVTTTHQITFSWQPASSVAVDGYNLELDSGDGYIAVVTTTNTFSATSLGAGLYTWRVRAFNIMGYSDYTAARAVEVLGPPGVPVLLTPPANAITTTHRITFTWQAAGSGSLPDGYNLELDGGVITLTKPSIALTLWASVHTWRVRAFNAAGYSDYAPLQTVRIVDAPNTPALVAPPDNTVTTTRNITFTWQVGSGGAPDGYNLELDSGDGRIAVITTTHTFFAASLTPGVHTWRVRSFNPAGYSSYTDARSVMVKHRVYLPLIVRNNQTP